MVGENESSHRKRLLIYVQVSFKTYPLDLLFGMPFIFIYLFNFF